MEGMVINNLSAQANTECGLLQQELLKSFVEQTKTKRYYGKLNAKISGKKVGCDK